MLIRVRDVIAAIADHVGGLGVDVTCDPAGVQKAIKTYNRINEVLMNRDDWPGTDFTVRFPTCGGVVVLPERFITIKALALDGNPSPIYPIGWQFLEAGPGEWVDNPSMQCLGHSFATERDLAAPMQLFAVSDQKEASNAHVTIRGYDAFNKFITSRIPLSKGNAEIRPKLSKAFKVIQSVTKPITAGYVDLAGWQNGAHWLSRMEPGDVSPCYTRYALNGFEGKQASVCASVSLRFRDIFDLDEVSLIQHREAYRLAAQGLNAFDDNDTARGSEYLGRAIKMLKDYTAKLQTGQRKALNVSVKRTLTRKYHR